MPAPRKSVSMRVLPLLRPALISFCAILPISAQESIRQATLGRVWLKVPTSQKPIAAVEVSVGSATNAPWETDAAVRERFTDIQFPVSWWDWREVTLSFTPPEDGTIELQLTGPWDQERPGSPYHEEVLWDDLTATGTTIENGEFEIPAESGPASWKPLYRPYPASGTWPHEGNLPRSGKAFGASWQNRPLSQILHLKAGEKVTLKLHAKAASIPGFIAPKRLGPNTAAHQAAAKLKRGINLGNCWEAPPRYAWGIRYTPEDIDLIAGQGFDHIRVPVAWSHYLKPKGDDYELDPQLLADLEPVLRRALDKKLHVLLDWHHFDDLTTDPRANRGRFIKGWETISQHFKSWPQELYLELLNEPRDALTTQVANGIHADTLAAIRRIDPQRIILISPGNWGDIRQLDQLVLPDGDDRVIVTVHCYEPFHFTHQAAGWVNLSALRGLTYPGPPATPFVLPESLRGNTGLRDFIEHYNTLPAASNPCSPKVVAELLDVAKSWSVHFGRPVHLGEFGSNNSGDQASRGRYARDVRILAEARDIPWTLWDWKATFGYWNTRTNQPLFRAALFE